MNPDCSGSRHFPVLLVEDEALIRMGLVLEFKTAGYEVHEAGNADEALALLQSGVAVCGILTDLRMPGRIDGLGLVSWLREHRPGLPVIVATGYPLDLPRDGRTRGISAIVSKPYKPAGIISLIERLVARALLRGPPRGAVRPPPQ